MENEPDLDHEHDHENNLEEDDDINETEEKTECPKQKEIDGISQDNWKLLEKVKSTQRRDHLKGITFGSPTANDRLMKELRDIFKSDHYKNGKLHLIVFEFINK